MDKLFYESVLRALNRNGVRYLVVGGVAVNLWGIPRMTRDLDIMAALDQGNLEKLVAALKELGYRPRAPIPLEAVLDPALRRSWIEDKHAVMMTFQDPAPPHQQLDIFLDNPIDFESAYAQRQELKAADMTVPLVSLDHLIELKSKADRLQDQADIAMLKKAQDDTSR
jgi:predicted nucleotidyltransferase